MKILAWIWLLCLSILLVWFLQLASNGLKIDTDIFALLPEDQKDPDLEQALRSQSQDFARNLIFLISHPERSQLVSATKELGEKLQANGNFEAITLSAEVDVQAFQEIFSSHAPVLANAGLIQKYKDKGGAKRFLKDTEALLYSPFSSFYARFIKNDPLLLAPRFLQSLPKPPGTPVDGVMIVHSRNGSEYGVIQATTKQNQFAIDGESKLIESVVTAVDSLQSKYAGTEIRYAGVARFSAASASQMKAELSNISVISLVSIFLILGIMFRSVWVLGVGLLPLAVGTFVGVAGTYLFYPKVHMLTFVFGTSLLGIGIDYSFQYLTQYRAKVGSSSTILKYILPGITLGALTTILAYIALGFPPFPGLRQMAVFSSLGVTAAFITVVVWFPALLKNSQPVQTGSQAEVNLKGLKRMSILSIPFVLLLAGVFWLSPNDDIRLLQKLNPELVEETKFVSETMGSFDPSRFLVVRGENEEQVFARLESLKSPLHALKEQDALGNFLLLSDFIPSSHTQRQSLQWVTSVTSDPEYKRYLEAIGFAGELQGANTDLLTIPDFSGTAFEKLLKSFWLGQHGDSFLALVPLSDVKSEKVVTDTASLPGVEYINKVSSYTSLLADYRRATTYVVIGAHILLFPLLILRYGLKRATLVMVPPVLAAGCALGTLGFVSQYYNLFSILALSLVLGIGIDYSIFLVEAKQLGPTFTAVLLTALTTILSFGLLALSSNPILYSIGLTVSVGIIVSFLFSPLVLFATGSQYD